MATLIEKHIGTGSPPPGVVFDYSTVSAAVAAMPADLTVADEQWTLYLYGDVNEGTGAVDARSITTDATRYIRITAGAGEGISDQGDVPLNEDTPATNLTSNSSWKDLLQLPAYSTVDNIVIGRGLVTTGITVSARRVNTTYRNCIIVGSPNRTSAAMISDTAGNAIVNCLVIVKSAAGSGITMPAGRANNNTIIALAAGSTGSGYAQTYGAPTIHNNIVLGFGTDYAPYYDAANYLGNISGDATGTAGLQGIAAASLFVDGSPVGGGGGVGDSRLAAGAPAIDAVQTNAAIAVDIPATDIRGIARSGTADIGAAEYVAAASATARVSATITAATTGTRNRTGVFSPATTAAARTSAIRTRPGTTSPFVAFVASNTPARIRLNTTGATATVTATATGARIRPSTTAAALVIAGMGASSRLRAGTTTPVARLSASATATATTLGTVTAIVTITADAIAASAPIAPVITESFTWQPGDYGFIWGADRHHFNFSEDSTEMEIGRITQSSGEHELYEVDATPWLTPRGFDPANIVSITFTVSIGAITWQEHIPGQATARCTLSGIQPGQSGTLTATLTYPHPNPGQPDLITTATIRIAGA